MKVVKRLENYSYFYACASVRLLSICSAADWCDKLRLRAMGLGIAVPARFRKGALQTRIMVLTSALA